MKDHMDTAHNPALPARKFPRFKQGQAVAVSVPIEAPCTKHSDELDDFQWTDGMFPFLRSRALTPGRMLRVVRVFPLCCFVLDVRSLRVFEIEKTCLEPWIRR